MTTLCASFMDQADRRPEAPALAWHGELTTYRELYQAMRAAKARVDALDLGEGEPVGILAAKSPEAVALILGCLLGRRRFLLPSPALAQGTLQRLFEQAGCRRVLTADTACESPHRRGPASVNDDVSFMLTTSGSTGLPKIVPLGQGAVDRFIGWAGRQFDIGPGNTVLNYAPLNFDLCLLDVWATLAHGGCVALVDPELGTAGGHLLDVMVRHRVNVVQAVPMFYRLVLDAASQLGGCRLDTVEHVVFTGDAIPDRTLAELPSLFPRARLYNVYGCTETNDSFIHEVERDAPDAPVPLGRPLPGVRAVVVDSEGAVVAGPGTGELWVATPFQTEGYLDRSRNLQRFMAHPTVDDGLRYFRTGDLVHRDALGRTVLAGRKDFQVKVRGVAVNTAEVERVLLQHPAVAEAVVVAVPDELAGRRLCCMVRRRPGSRLNTLAVRQHCAQRLPLAAVPSVMRIVDDPLPRTSTGKVDRHQVEGTYQSSPTRSHTRTGCT